MCLTGSLPLSNYCVCSLAAGFRFHLYSMCLPLRQNFNVGVTQLSESSQVVLSNIIIIVVIHSNRRRFLVGIVSGQREWIRQAKYALAAQKLLVWPARWNWFARSTKRLSTSEKCTLLHVL